MAETATQPHALKTRAAYEAAIQRCLDEMDRLQEQIARDLDETERLKRETRVILDQIKAR